MIPLLILGVSKIRMRFLEAGIRQFHFLPVHLRDGLIQEWVILRSYLL